MNPRTLRLFGFIFFRLSVLSFYLLFTLTSCAVAPNHGLILTEISYPGEFNTENDVLDKKEGIGCQISILGLVSYGDASAGGVARNYAISKISTTDYNFTGVLFPIYGKLCIHVRGE